MSLLSSTVSIARYRVEGIIEAPVLEKIEKGLKKNAISDIENEPEQKAVGWTSFEDPYVPDFDGSSFVIGTYMLFSLRIDKKSIPAKVVKKLYTEAVARKMAETGRDSLSRNEKQGIKDHVINTLNIRMPAVPNSYDLLWSVEDSFLWFFSTQKSANEELETIFPKSFGPNLIRLFPYTCGFFESSLSEKEQGIINNLSPTRFTE
ncbi:recombination-associated protein RdgC [Desulfobacterales bacterium HSG16]|nr:recombination-associated protein RdgC [Desulfobacterales bacterium HSG16]